MMASRVPLVLLYHDLYHLNLLFFILLYLILSCLILFSWLSTLYFFSPPPLPGLQLARAFSLLLFCIVFSLRVSKWLA